MYSNTTMLLLTLRLQIFIKLILSKSTLIAKVTLDKLSASVSWCVCVCVTFSQNVQTSKTNFKFLYHQIGSGVSS